MLTVIVMMMITLMMVIMMAIKIIMIIKERNKFRIKVVDEEEQ